MNEMTPWLMYALLPLIASSLVLMLMVHAVQKFYKQYRTAQNDNTTAPPGSRGLPWIGETIHFYYFYFIKGGRFYDFVRLGRLRYGNCFKIKLFGETHVFVSTTHSAKYILNNDLGGKLFTKRYTKSVARLIGDQSILVCASHHHKLIRSRLINLFSSDSLSSLIRQFDQLVVDNLNGWDQYGSGTDVVVVLHEALTITFKAMCKMLISLEDEREIQTLQKDVALVCEAMLAFPLNLPRTRFHKGILARKRIMRRLQKMISERRRNVRCEEDFLQHLLNVDVNLTAAATSLSDAQIQDNILTMIIAGQDTTASAITWMVKYLGENKQILEKLKAEAIASTNRSSGLTLHDLNQMTFASKVAKESLRMSSIVQWFPRVALSDCEIEGYKIRKGWNVNIDVRSIHLDPTVYNEPDMFNPCRWMEDEPKIGACSLLAFGTGGRTCLGMNMAKTMMLVFLHRLITTYQWKVIDSDSTVDKWSMFSRLKTGCPIRITRHPLVITNL